MSDEPINCTRVKCSNCDNVVFIMTDENSTQEFIDWVHKEKTNIACFKCLKDHVSKSELRAWCEAYLKAIGHKQCNAYTIREATVIYDILEKFCAGEK